MPCGAMTLPMVTCPLCCRPGFSSSDSLCSALVEVTTRKLCCPICNDVVNGLDKFTIHLFSHSINKVGIEASKDSSRSNNLCLNGSTEIKNQLPALESYGIKGISENEGDNCEKDAWKPEGSQKVNFPANSYIYYKEDNGQVFAIPTSYIGASLKNVTINTQNYITNTNITTSGPQTNNIIDKVQKRKYSQVFDAEETKNDMSRSDSYSNIGSVNSWVSTSSLSSETDKQNSTEKEFESCRDLLTKGDFSTTSDEICDLDLKKDSGNIELDDTDEEKNDKKKKLATCDFCSIILPNKTILAMHKQLIHRKPEAEVDKPETEKPLLCNMCPRTFNLRSSLMIHRRVAHDGGFGSSVAEKESQVVPKGNFCCKTCGKYFKKDFQLAHHLKIHEEKQWQCSTCSKTFTTKYFLKKHRRLHTGETPYKCTKCDKAFTFQQSYHKHLLYHNDDKPYCCSQCGRLFKELSTLHNHERIHSGEKPFKCETCGKSFRQRVSYLVHRRIHTGAMPYKCTACNKSFRYKISQRTHKCTAQPPGVVVRTAGSLVERLQAAMLKVGETGTTPEVSTPSDKNQTEPEEAKQTEVAPKQTTGTQAELGSPAQDEGGGPEPTPMITLDPKSQADKPQVYILLKGPNEETYYQPLIITQTVGSPGSQNVSYQVSPLTAPLSSLPLEHQNNLSPKLPKEEPKKNTQSKKYFKKSDGSKKQVQENWPVKSHSETMAAMEEILNELNSPDFQTHPSSNDNNGCDAVIMDSNDLFSFILSPDMSSPSDKLNKLTLSPRSNESQQHSLNDNQFSSSMDEQDQSFLDAISDQALKELLFGSATT